MNENVSPLASNDVEKLKAMLSEQNEALEKRN
jgi:hypothetical protein